MGEDIHDDQGYLAAPEPIDMNAGGITDKDIQDFLTYRDRLNAAKNSRRDRVTTASNSPSADRLTAASRGVIDHDTVYSPRYCTGYSTRGNSPRSSTGCLPGTHMLDQLSNSIYPMYSHVVILQRNTNQT